MNLYWFIIFWEAFLSLGAVTFFFIPRQWDETKRKDRFGIIWMRKLLLAYWLTLALFLAPSLVTIMYLVFNQPVPGALRILAGFLNQSNWVFTFIMWAFVYIKGYKVGK